ncbi:glycine betaine ABC transporter substrate-binding protein [Lentibacillus halophilus]|uniref:Glycine betaine ABC transporter substrate-binding protein n=1 Tax=Lentibacillus halophilus TaxID=295065 RepID=A0ABP3JAL1_9BACI
MLTLSMLLAACGDDGEANGESDSSGDGSDNGEESTEEPETEGPELGQKELTEPYVAWARETVSTEMLKQLLEKAGYTVEKKQVEAGAMFSSMADGSADFQTSTWLPATHKPYWDKYGDKLVKVNQVLDEAPLALTVPSYMDDVNSMKDLKGNEELGESVGWEITGIDPGAGIMQNTQDAFKEYGLENWELLESSEAAMITELKSAIENKEPIIVPLWKPHWAFGVMDLKMLDDSKKVYGGKGDQIYTVARKGLKEDAPRAYKVMEQYDESYDMINKLMPKVHQEDKPVEDVVKNYLDNNQDKVDKWLDGIPTE